ncbi:MAG: hypothetical protein OXI23_05220 [Gemmatimonadota bacterium]|nr:hypothetical protein [Gemmatimonadota bacterium]
MKTPEQEIKNLMSQIGAVWPAKHPKPARNLLACLKTLPRLVEESALSCQDVFGLLREEILQARLSRGQGCHPPNQHHPLLSPPTHPEAHQKKQK